jgi:hypothetical protein
MYTSKMIKAMTDKEARAAVEALAAQRYGNTRWKTQFAIDTGLARSSVQGWFIDTRPPTWVIVMLAAMVERDRAVADLASIKAAIASAFVTPPSSAQS